MNDFLDRISKLPPKRLILLALELQSKVEELQRAGRDSIAIVGMGCRLPGKVETPEDFWRLLRDGVEAVDEISGDLCDREASLNGSTAPGTIRGGFLDRVDRFDPEFFGILPGEARMMDPQQRLVLEVGWEAIEDAGMAADRLAGSPTGVFIGVSTNDFSHLIVGADPGPLGGYLATGTSTAFAAGRLSYALGLNGPSLTLDTTCSSSLVAICLACDSLRARRCSTALAGGVNLILSPEATTVLTRAGVMAPDGRCKAFDASADGFVRSEGCGIVVLRRLVDAQADGDRILAVIRGTAVNQDGRSGGLTAPNGPAQQALIREALLDAGLQAGRIQYVEAHGTGTALGDPIEVQALAAVLGDGRAESNPLLIGSVKTNLGHLEAAAGVAGLIKAVLALRHGEVPPHLHLRTPNPHIDWAEIPVAVPTCRTPWPTGAEPRVAAVSSFGFSGTNAHVIIEQAPAESARVEGPERPLHLLRLSARSESALAELAGRFGRRLAEDPTLSAADACYTANTGRSQFAHRLAVIGDGREQLALRLDAFAAGTAGPGIAAGRVEREGEGREVVFLFAGEDRMGAGPGIARELYQSQPTFRKAVDRCGPIGGEPSRFAVQYALAELLRSWGIAPAATVGDESGEYAAACVRGELPLDRALERVADRARPAESSSGGGPSFPEAIRGLYAQGYRVFLEIGPASASTDRAREILPDAGCLFLPTLRLVEGDWAVLLETLAALHCRGVTVDWSGFDCEYSRRIVSLPTYPFERARYWPEIAKPSPIAVSTPDQPWSDWLYELRWEPRGLEADDRSSASGRWLIFADDRGWGRRLATALDRAGGECTLVTKGMIARGEDHAPMLDAFLRSDPRPCRGVVDLRALDEVIDEDGGDDVSATQERACGGLLYLAQALARSNASPTPPLTVVTAGGQSTTGDGRGPKLAQAPNWGLGRVIALEHPDLRCLRIDLDPCGERDQIPALLTEIARTDRADEAAFRDGRRLVPRLVRVEARRPARSTNLPRGDGCYLVTGGLGGLGLATARWLVENGASHLVLVGRSEPSAEALSAIREIERLEAVVHVVQADVSRREDVDRLLGRIESAGFPLRGIIHGAGTIDDGVLLDQTWDRFESVMAAKVQGSWNLHRATIDLPLDFFVLYSSGASLLGSPGQGNYAAANAFLDALASYRGSLGLPGLAINWGRWASVGLAARGDNRNNERWTALGVGAIEPVQGLEVLGFLLGQARRQVAVLPIDWARLTAGSLPPEFLPSLLRTMAVDDRSIRPGTSGSADCIRDALPERRRELLVGLVREAVNRLFLFDRPRPVGEEENLIELGLDSLSAIQIGNQLKRALGISLPSMIALDNSTIGEIADVLLEAVESCESSDVNLPPEDMPPTPEVSIANGRAGDWDPYRARRALDELGTLSDAEVEAMLRDIKDATGGGK